MIVIPAIYGLNTEITGIILLSGSGLIGKLHSPVKFLQSPYMILKAFRTSMQMVWAAIYRKLILSASYFQTSAGYAVRITSRAFSKTRAVCNIIEGIGICQSHIVDLAFTVRHSDADNPGSERGKFNPCARGILNSDDCDISYG